MSIKLKNTFKIIIIGSLLAALLVGCQQKMPDVVDTIIEDVVDPDAPHSVEVEDVVFEDDAVITDDSIYDMDAKTEDGEAIIPIKNPIISEYLIPNGFVVDGPHENETVSYCSDLGYMSTIVKFYNDTDAIDVKILAYKVIPQSEEMGTLENNINTLFDILGVSDQTKRDAMKSDIVSGMDILHADFGIGGSIQPITITTNGLTTTVYYDREVTSNGDRTYCLLFENTILK